MKRLTRQVVSLSVFAALTTGSIAAHAAEGWYVGFAAPYNAVGGDFTGDRVYTSSVDTILVSKVSSGFGWGIYGGTHFTPNFDLEVSFLQTNHDGTFTPLPSKDVAYSMLNIDVRYFVKTEDTPVFIQVGLGTRDITVKDGAVNNNTGAPLGDATYLGDGFNFGVGLTHELKENVILSASAIYRTASFDRAEGSAAGVGKLDKKIDGPGLGFTVGVAYDVRP